MIEDEILREIRATRDAFAARFDYNLAAMCEHLRKEQEEGNWPVVRLAPRRPEGRVEPKAVKPAEVEDR